MRSLLQRRGESLAAFSGVFRNPSLRRLELAFAGSDIGSWIATIALSVLVFERSGAAAPALPLFAGIRISSPDL